MIIDAKNNIIISFNPHRINIEITNAAIDIKVDGFNLDFYLLINEFACLEAKRINLLNSFSEFQL